MASFTLYDGDNLDVLQKMIDDGIQVDSVVTDPPYGLEFMGVAWDSFSDPKGRARTDDAWKDHGSKEHARTASQQARIARNKGKAFESFTRKWADLVFQLLKPGGYLLSFGGTRTYHRMVVAIEDAGFEIRDQIAWLYGSGFPKSHDVSKAIDKAAGVEREVIGQRQDILTKQAADLVRGTRKILESFDAGAPTRNNGFKTVSADITAPATPAAVEWSGWGTALKPAFEPIVLARKPLEGTTVAENVLKHGTGALNVDGCRITYEAGGNLASNPSLRTHINGGNGGKIFGTEENRRVVTPNAQGRWPANVILDEEAGAMLDDQSGKVSYGKRTGGYSYAGNAYDVNGFVKSCKPQAPSNYGDSGGASRFFYCAKASKKERHGSKHPTVKPLSLMRYLCRLVTPPGGLVLDPFAGSGTTGEAAILEGFHPILIEREPEYIKDIEARLNSEIKADISGLFGE